VSEHTAENDVPRFRIDFTIYRDDEEVGYGASTPEGSVVDALYALESVIQNRLWETTPDMPEPYDLERVTPPGEGRAPDVADDVEEAFLRAEERNAEWWSE
jgi:hypothetical protein